MEAEIFPRSTKPIFMNNMKRNRHIPSAHVYNNGPTPGEKEQEDQISLQSPRLSDQGFPSGENDERASGSG